jgi:AcrR family transcriptional regulator
MRKGQSHPSSNISKNMLAQGLMELLEEKEYKAITITQLCEQAKIARRTFYRHFESKEDILSYYISCIIN